MSSKILIKRSTTSGSVPTTSDLDTGELGLNTADKRLYTNNSGTIVELGTYPSSQAVQGNATVGGTLGVTGATTLSSGTVSGNWTVTGTLTVGTPTNSTDAASKGYVDTAVANVIDAAPGALDTLNELAAAINDDANFATTITTALATKLPLAGGTMTGAINMGSNKITTTYTPTDNADLTTKTYVDGILGSATSAATSATAAASSASNAATSATNAATSATTATTQASAASTSATNAASSASAASTSASSASTSATAAATSATAASTAATNAAASYDSFDDRYLGAKSSAPSVDNDGDALVTGALYYDTTAGGMYVYTGSAWEASFSAASGFVATTGDSMTGNLTFGDNVKAIFGAGSDLQIYHDGSSSIITESGLGNLQIQGVDLILESTTGENYFRGVNNGAVSLYYDNAIKLDTTSTGIDVTGTVTADKLDVSDSVAAGFASTVFENTDGTGYVQHLFNVGSGQAQIGYAPSIYFAIGPTSSDTTTPVVIRNNNATQRIKADVNGDISFYEDTGTTAKFFWDASAESLGIGTSSPSAALHISSPSNARGLKLQNSSSISASQITFLSDDGTEDSYVRNQASSSGQDILSLGTGGAERMRIDSSGNVGIGTSSPYGRFTVKASGNNYVNGLIIEDTDSTTRSAITHINGDTFISSDASNTHMLIDSSGNVGIGTSSPSSQLEVSGSAGPLVKVTSTATGTPTAFVYSSTNGADFGSLTNHPTRFYVNNSERMRIDSSGNVLVGITANESVNGISLNPTIAPGIILNKSFSGNANAVRFWHNYSQVGSIQYSNTGTSYNTSSDYRLKTDVQPMTGATERLKALKPVNFEWISSGERVDGFLAHEAQEVVPEAVTGTKDAMRTEEYEVTPAVLDDDGNVVTEAVMGEREVPDYQGIDQSKLVPLLVATVQEQQAVIESLTARIEALENN